MKNLLFFMAFLPVIPSLRFYVSPVCERAQGEHEHILRGKVGKRPEFRSVSLRLQIFEKGRVRAQFCAISARGENRKRRRKRE